MEGVLLGSMGIHILIGIPSARIVKAIAFLANAISLVSEANRAKS